MNYIKCKKCEKEISLQEPICPNCGNQISQSDILEQRNKQRIEEYIANIEHKKFIIGIFSIIQSICNFILIFIFNIYYIEIGKEIDYMGFILSILTL